MRSPLSFLALLLTACADPTTVVMPDSGTDPMADAAPGDNDAGIQEDAGVVLLPDSGTAPDAGSDAGLAPDSGSPDAGGDAGSTMTVDAGTDAGGDAGSSSAGAAVQLALGAEHSCVLRTTGRTRCWGNPVHALGWGSDPFGSPVQGVADAVAITASTSRACALRPDGSVWCWGSLTFTGDASPSGGITTMPLRIAGLAPMDEIAAQCGVTTSGTVQCWDTGAGGVTAPPAGIAGAIDIDQFDTSFCAARADGSVTCWGPTPSVTPFVAGITQVSVGQGRACVLAGGGSVWCWDSSAPTPVGRGGAVGESSPYVEVAQGGAHACARRENGSVWCWGRNDFGQLGRTTSVTTDMTAGEVLFAGARMDAVAIDSGRDHSCAALRDGRVVCWGSNSNGQLGTWVPGGMTTAPVVPDYY